MNDPVAANHWRTLLRALAARVSTWVALLWGTATILLATAHPGAPVPAAELPAKTRFVAVALLPDDPDWHALEWALGPEPPVAPPGARFAPIPSSNIEVATAEGRPLNTALSRDTGDIVTVSGGYFERTSYRYRLVDGTIAAVAHQTRWTLLAWLIAGALALLGAAIVRESLPPLRTHGGKPPGWWARIVPLQWEATFTGTRDAVRQALKSGGWLRLRRPAIAREILAQGAGGDARLVALRRPDRLPRSILASRWLAAAAVTTWLLPLVLPAAWVPIPALLLITIACAITSAGFRIAGDRARLPDGRPWDTRPWRFIVDVWPDRWANRAWHVGAAILPPTVFWCLAGLLQIVRGTLDPWAVGVETAVTGLAALLAIGALRWAAGRGRRPDDQAALARSVTAALHRIPPVDESRRARAPIFPTFIEWGIVVTIIGILATLASSQHRGYIHQADVVEVLRSTSVVTTPLADYRMRTGRWPASWAEFDPPLAAPLVLVRGVRATPGPDGMVELRFPRDYPLAALRGGVLPLVPEAGPGAAWTWTPCRGLGLPLEYRPRHCRS